MGDTFVFRNARVLDGSGAPAYSANVRVNNRRITDIGNSDDEGSDGIDLEGAYLAPGFIDMHAHSELRLLQHPGAAAKLTQGVTLEVLGQDGVSVAPVPDSLSAEWADCVRALDGSYREPWPWRTIPEYLDKLDETLPAVNVAYLAPHGNLRSRVAGFDDRELTASETETLQEAVGAAIREGVFGLSTGLIYPPSAYARDPELVALAETLDTHSTMLVSHVWNETNRVVDSIERFLDICRQGGCHAHISHLKVGGRQKGGAATAIREHLDRAEAAGQRVSFDQYPYTAASTMLTALLPPWARTGDSETICKRLRDADVRDRIRRALEEPGDWENLVYAAGSWENILITQTASGTYEGETVDAIADKRDQDPVDAVCDLLVDEALDVTMAHFIMAEPDIEAFLQDDRGTFCTDGIFGGKPHPRVIGTFGRLLERYIRDRGVLTPAQMAYKAAGRPADILGLPDRGYIREGYVADLVVFDLGTVSENATYENPWQYTDGIDYVMVNGTLAVADGELTDNRAGEILRSHREWDGDMRPKLNRAASDN